jgi:peptidoglycan L-alanyl-D-glutamate endopeptidase CwlK
MAKKDLKPLILAVQHKLGLTEDGIAGPITWGAIDAALSNGVSPGEPSEPELKMIVDGVEIDKRSRDNIDTLLPEVKPIAIAFLVDLKKAGINAKITSGTRSWEEQQRLYDRYKNKGGPVAAPPGQSNHNYGLAWDITLFEDDNVTPIYESELYKKAGSIGRSMGLVWGGTWANGDEPHFELHPTWARDMSERDMLVELKKRAESRSPIMA